MRTGLFFLSLLVGTWLTGHAQELSREPAHTLTLTDVTCVTLMASAANHRQWYYLPQQLRLSLRQDRPEISLLLYRHENSRTLSGGLLHLLLTWGLTPAQESELSQRLKSDIDSFSVLIGAAAIEPVHSSPLEIVSSAPLADVMRQSLTNRPLLPLAPEHKTALAFRFNEKDATLVSIALSNTDQWKDIRFRFTYHYTIAVTKGLVRTVKRQPAVTEGLLEDWIEAAVVQTK